MCCSCCFLRKQESPHILLYRVLRESNFVFNIKIYFVQKNLFTRLKSYLSVTFQTQADISARQIKAKSVYRKRTEYEPFIIVFLLHNLLLFGACEMANDL